MARALAYCQQIVHTVHGWTASTMGVTWDLQCGICLKAKPLTAGASIIPAVMMFLIRTSRSEEPCARQVSSYTIHCLGLDMSVDRLPKSDYESSMRLVQPHPTLLRTETT